MGSVKDLQVVKPPKLNHTGIGRFIFSDRYSIFDWGEMPNHIKNKGKSLCIIGAYFFEQLESIGIKTHYRGVIENGTVKKLAELNEPSNIMEVNLLRVIKPEMKEDTYYYGVYQNEKTNFLIPLEIIYRNYLPESSSIFKRLKTGNLKPEDIGLNRVPEPGEKLIHPIIDVSTKLEPTDRYISWSEAQKNVNLSDSELNKIQNITLTINKVITENVRKLNLINEDGKIELGFDENRTLILVDVFGTPDECRFTYNSIPVSKEALRIYYRNTEWFNEIEKAKTYDKLNWKKYVRLQPPPLPEKLNELISMVYQSFCNQITERKWFDTPDLMEVLKELKEFIY